MEFIGTIPLRLGKIEIKGRFDDMKDSFPARDVSNRAIRQFADVFCMLADSSSDVVVLIAALQADPKSKG